MIQLTVSIVLIVVSAALFFVGMPNKNGESPRFLRFSAAPVLYPPIIMALFVSGLAGLISAYFGIQQ